VSTLFAHRVYALSYFHLISLCRVYAPSVDPILILRILVSSKERERYTAIIDVILETADLETISRKKVRQGLEKSLGGKDLSDQKVRPHTHTHAHARPAMVNAGPSPLLATTYILLEQCFHGTT
jgi:hypothetical protein